MNYSGFSSLNFILSQLPYGCLIKKLIEGPLCKLKRIELEISSNFDPMNSSKFSMNHLEVHDITLRMIIEAGLIKAETKVFAATDDKISGVLNSDGSITLNIDNQPKNFPFPSGAARSITKTSVSGWIFWKIDDNGRINDLLFYKKKYIEIAK